MQRQTLHTFLDNEIAEYGLDPKLSQLIINCLLYTSDAADE